MSFVRRFYRLGQASLAALLIAVIANVKVDHPEG